VQDKQNIHVHHMHLKNVEQRTVAESKATADIIEYMKKNIFFFMYSESTHEWMKYFQKNFQVQLLFKRNQK